MTPYYEDDYTTIYHGSSLEIIPTLVRPDIVVADPPYGMNFQSGMRRIKYKKIEGDDKLPLDIITLAIRRAKAAAYIFCRWNNLPEMPVPQSVLAWVKNNRTMGDLKHEHGRQWEACCFYAKKEHRFIKRTADVIFANQTGNKLHPTQKPVPLIREIIEANHGDLVLDPFMGSGTTLVAARLCGRQAIGIEIDEEYCRIAAKRIQDLNGRTTTHNGTRYKQSAFFNVDDIPKKRASQ